jgi:hypothetical protein
MYSRLSWMFHASRRAAAVGRAAWPVRGRQADDLSRQIARTKGRDRSPRGESGGGRAQQLNPSAQQCYFSFALRSIR